MAGSERFDPTKIDFILKYQNIIIFISGSHTSGRDQFEGSVFPKLGYFM
jgi:hypothetical protein